MEFTKGPWRKEGRFIKALKEKSICSVPGDHIRICKIDEANAQLIASAPDMYNALMMIMPYMKGFPDGYFSIAEIEAVENAIAKAEGRE